MDDATPVGAPVIEATLISRDRPIRSAKQSVPTVPFGSVEISQYPPLDSNGQSSLLGPVDFGPLDHQVLPSDTKTLAL